jgi:hypothetical protein
METKIVTGAFTNVADQPFFIPIRCQIDEFRLVNLTRSGITAFGIAGSLSSTLISQAEFFPRYMSRGTALVYQNGTAVGNVSPLSAGNLAQNGFTLIDGSAPPRGPNIVINSFVPGTTTVFTTNTAHGFAVGDIVRIGSMTSAPQMGGITMTVTAVGSTTTFTTLFNSSNALTSVGIVYRVLYYGMPGQVLYYPEVRAIAGITLANPMVVTTLVQQNYQIGDVVRFQIPTVFGATQLNSTTNGLPVEFTVIAVNNAVGTQTVTLAYDATALTAFAWPAATSYPFGLPEMVPQGEGNINNFQSFGIVPAPLPYANQNILGFATQNQAQNGILIGVGDGTAATTTGGLINSTSHAIEAWEWRAICSEMTFP